MKRTNLLQLLSFLVLATTAQACAAMDFSEGKRVMYRVHAAMPVEIYCGCQFTGSAVNATCPVATNAHRDRLGRIEAEHIVPAADFGRQRACWRTPPPGMSGRENCRETDAVFREMEGDPMNLYPSIGALNAIRSDYRYGEVQGEAREFGACDFEIAGEGRGRFVEPPEAVKGLVARTYFYMEAVYGLRVGDSQRRLLEAWSRSHPPSQWEYTRARAIEQYTGRRNPVLFPSR